ncbi:hypothetical protein KOI35_18325 [Actinoplanes bogorensis]|uniref:DUF6896 domain-containing protein n=1 Tax=Paractinoplanes bogorensis TaxID=1610840 RepID=A0ABS5YPT9_9ACTN|nr:hypothetical protein [Actinoplanes bogorensis]MBU2665467.1 hypothetical protein [Actinoplanes bogorensis]
MAADGGREVDVDVIDRVEAFDAWRICWFLDEVADGGLTTVDIEAACRRLVAAGEWFAPVPYFE